MVIIRATKETMYIRQASTRLLFSRYSVSISKMQGISAIMKYKLLCYRPCESSTYLIFSLPSV